MVKKLSRRSIRKNKNGLIKSRIAKSHHPSIIQLPKAFWLQTHYWHVKRFQMITLWNYRLALQSNSKMYRPTIRAITKGCTLYDLSYEECFIIKDNSQMDILSILSNMKEIKWERASSHSLYVTRPTTIATISKHCSNTKFESGASIDQILGPKDELIGVVGCESISSSTTWQHLLWIHPSISDCLWNHIKPLAQSYRGSFSRFELCGPKFLSVFSSVFKVTLPKIFTPSFSVKIYSDNQEPEIISPCAILEDNLKKSFYTIRVRILNFPRETTMRSDSLMSYHQIDPIAAIPIETKPMSFPTLDSSTRNFFSNRVELIVPISKAMEVWKMLVYSNTVLPIGLSERRTMHEQVLSLSDIDPIILFPWYVPGTEIFSTLVKNDYEKYVIQIEAKRPPSKRKVLTPPSEFFTNLLLRPSISILQNIKIAPIVMVHRGRPCFAATIYLFIDYSKKSILLSPVNNRNNCSNDYNEIPLPLESEIKKVNSYITTDSNINSNESIDNNSTKYHNYQPLQLLNLQKSNTISQRVNKIVLGFTILNPISERYVACNGYSSITGSGYALCVYDQDILPRELLQGKEDIVCWVENPSTPTILYPAHLRLNANQ